jgi:cysteine desulfurase
MGAKANTITLYEKEPAGSVDLSPVLRAMGVPPGERMGALRFSLGRGTTEAEIRDVAERLIRVAETMPAVPAPIA